MKTSPALSALTMLCLGSAAQAGPVTMAAMRWHRRVVLIATPSPQDLNAIKQRQIFADWAIQAADRDISLVEVSRGRMTGAADDGASLTRKYHLEPSRFEVLLIGKDGSIALRSKHPITAARLQATIDAMPMRKAGER